MLDCGLKIQDGGQIGLNSGDIGLHSGDNAVDQA